MTTTDLLDPPREHRPKHPRADEDAPLRREHASLRTRLRSLGDTAERIASLPTFQMRAELDRAIELVERHLRPHVAGERDVTRALVAGATGLLSDGSSTPDQQRAAVLAGELGVLRERLASEDCSAEIAAGLRRVLYGLHAIFSIHFADEDERVAPAAQPFGDADGVFAVIERAQRDARERNERSHAPPVRAVAQR